MCCCGCWCYCYCFFVLVIVLLLLLSIRWNTYRYVIFIVHIIAYRYVLLWLLVLLLLFFCSCYCCSYEIHTGMLGLLWILYNTGTCCCYCIIVVVIVVNMKYIPVCYVYCSYYNVPVCVVVAVGVYFCCGYYCYYYRFDPMRFRFDSISIGCQFGTDSTQFQISFDSILIQFDSIRFAPLVTYSYLLSSVVVCTSMPRGEPTSPSLFLHNIFWYHWLHRSIKWKDGVKGIFLVQIEDSISTLHSHRFTRAATSTSRLIHIST
jgi:hypothetical protein